jgi:hypothetical protein
VLTNGPHRFSLTGEGRDFINHNIARCDGDDDLHIPPPPIPPSPCSTRTAIEQDDDERLLRDFVESGNLVESGRDITDTNSKDVQLLLSIGRKES